MWTFCSTPGTICTAWGTTHSYVSQVTSHEQFTGVLMWLASNTEDCNIIHYGSLAKLLKGHLRTQMPCCQGRALPTWLHPTGATPSLPRVGLAHPLAVHGRHVSVREELCYLYLAGVDHVHDVFYRYAARGNIHVVQYIITLLMMIPRVRQAVMQCNIIIPKKIGLSCTRTWQDRTILNRKFHLGNEKRLINSHKL